MKEYILITNMWGRKRNIFGQLFGTLEEERQEFDTLDEANAFIELFEGICKSYRCPKDYYNPCWFQTWDLLVLHKTRHYLPFNDDKQRVWGYVLGKRDKREIIKIGGVGLIGLPPKSPKAAFIDALFRGENEVPKDYKWDVGEYEGWLQYRWGDGKNAVGYIEKPSPKKVKKEENLPENQETDEWEDYMEKEQDKIDNERMKILSERW